jgi:hypothetical protein
MVSEPAGIALVGVGRMGSVHLEALTRAEGVRLAGVVEPFERHGPAWRRTESRLMSR